MAKWNMVAKIDEIKSDLDNLYIKHKQKDDMAFIIEELNHILQGIIDHLKDKSKFNLWFEKHIAKEVHPNADI